MSRGTLCTIPRIGITCRSRDETSSSKIVQSDGRSTIKKLYSRPDGQIIIIQSTTRSLTAHGDSDESTRRTV